MKIQSLRCQQCGASLTISTDVRFLACNYCQSQLEVVREGDVTHTKILEVVEEVRQDQEAIASRVNQIEIRRRLAELEESWREVLRSFGRFDQATGQWDEPSPGGAFVNFLGPFVCGAVVAFVLRGKGPAAALLAIVAGALVGTFWARGELQRLKEFEEYRDRYEKEKELLRAELRLPDQAQGPTQCHLPSDADW